MVRVSLLPKGGVGLGSYGMGAGAPEALPLPGWREFCSPSWRFWLAEGQGTPADHLLTVTAEPEQLDRVVATMVGVVHSMPAAAPKVIRLARDAAILRRLNQVPRWAGRAVTLYMEDRKTLMDIAHVLDGALAGQGFSGPPAFRGRPYSGRSGMLFVCSSHVGLDGAQSNNSGRLTALLGGAPT